jgi:ABC-type polysaccharide/polyol phosphate export permease
VDYALSLLEPHDSNPPEITGANTPEQKARKEITCELLFFELAAVGFLGIAAVLFKEKGMGVIRVHAILPLRKSLFLLSKLAVFLLSDLVFAVLLTLLNVGLADGAAVLPAVLLQTAILSLLMALVGLLCALLLKDFRQFTLAYLVVTIFAASPVFLSANTPVKLDWIGYHPFYHVYMGLKNACFGAAVSPAYYVGAIGAIVLLFLLVQLAFRREMEREG